MAERLRARRPEIEQATLLRIHAVSAPPASAGPEYVDGLRNAVAAGLDYGLAGVELGEEYAPPIPEALLKQARLAARSGVSLDTVLRRYLAGHALLDDFLIEEAESNEERFNGATLKRLLRSQAAILDHLLAAISKVYSEEVARRPRGSERQKAERIERLLDGVPLDPGGLGYDLNFWHLGLVISATNAQAWLAMLAEQLECRLLLLRREEGICWAWLGSGRSLDPERVRAVGSQESSSFELGLGEPGEGLGGWRLTHRQARAALSVALRSGRPERYSTVALLASVARDEVLAPTLQQLYLTPLEAERDGGKALRETLRAYFAAGQNVTSAAAALGVSRQTVTSRLRTAERRIRRPLPSCAAELTTALQLRAMAPSLPPQAPPRAAK